MSSAANCFTSRACADSSASHASFASPGLPVVAPVVAPVVVMAPDSWP
jgi:hypothetical protein